MHARNNVPRCGGDSQIVVMYRETETAGKVRRETIRQNEEFLEKFERAVEPLMFSGHAINVSVLIVTTAIHRLKRGPGQGSRARPAAWCSFCSGDWSGYNVFRNAMSCWRSSGFRFSPKVWPGIARASVPSGLNPPGT